MDDEITKSLNDIEEREDDLKKQQDKLVEDRKEIEEKDIAENQAAAAVFGSTETARNQDQTYQDLIKHGFSPAEILNLIDAIIRGDLRHISIEWLK